MGLFDVTDEDFNEVEEFSPGVKAGIYEAIVSAVETERKDSGLYLVLSYTITQEDSPEKGKTHKEFQRIIEGRAQNDKDRQTLQFQVTRMLQLGVDKDRMKTLEPEDLVGTEIILTLVDQKKNPAYRNVSRVALLDGGGADVPMPVASAKAAVKGSANENPFA